MESMEVPEFLQNSDIDDIQDEMLALVPDKYDKSEGHHYYNFTRPSAHVMSQLIGFYLPRAIALIWPKFSNGEYLDLHAELRNMFRKEAQYANGTIVISGKAGTTIPSGYLVSTVAKNNVTSKDYKTLESCVIGDDGTVEVKAISTVAGKEGNTAANTIILNTTGFEDVTGINNPSEFIGGVDEESDELFFDRVLEYDKTQGDSNVGNPSDFKRWAEEVPGTGSAKVLRPSDNSGIITIVLTDGNGDPATELLCQQVYNYIMSPNDDNARLAPCGANLLVIPPTTVAINVSAKIKLSTGSITSVTNAFITKAKEYFNEALQDKEILYQRIGNALGDTLGVYDFRDLLVNDSTSNIPLGDGVHPTIDASNITFTLIEE